MNAFLDLAERQIPAPIKARRRAVEKRAATREEKALADRGTMFDAWKLWRRERLDALLAGPHGDAVRELVAFLQEMKLTDGTALLEHVRAGNWPQADADVRFEILSLINAAIVRARKRAGLEPFDDGMFDEPPCPFLIIRELFR